MEEEIGKVAEEVTENTDAQAVEEFGEGIELTDTAETEKETVEETKEEQPKGRFMTDEEIDNLVMKKVNRRMAKLEAQKEKELSVYKDTENVLKSALGANNIDEANKKLREYYTAEGVKLPDVYKPGLTSREVEVLAKADAQDFIDDGYESMLNEANRLAAKEYKNLNERERIVFNTLAEKLTQEDNKRNLLKLGATQDILDDKEFIDFKNQFNSKTPIGDIYNLYLKTRDSKTKPVAMGSMKDTVAQKETKDFYSPTDVKNLSDDDWNKPGVWERALASMKKWKE